MPFPIRSTSIGTKDDMSMQQGDGGEYNSPHTSRLMSKRGAGNPMSSYMAAHGSLAPIGDDGKRNMMTTPELMRPSPGNPARKSESQTAVFNLLATVVGGGVLSLPYALSLTGVILGIVLLLLAAVAADFSLYVLCSCSRRTGKTSFVQVAYTAFGPWGGGFTTFVLLVLSIFVLIAYMVLVRDVWGGLVGLALGAELDTQQLNKVLMCLLALLLPACLATSLHAVRHMCYVGFFSAILLTAALGYRSVEYNNKNPGATMDLKLVADNWGDVMEAFPIMSLAYMCHLNMLSVHSHLVNPTRERLRGLLHGTIGLASCLYVVLALCGYLYAYENTKDDILLNFSPADPVMLLGRVGMGLTMLVAITMMTLPCRDVIYEVAGVIEGAIMACCTPSGYDALNTPGTPGSPGSSLNSCFKVSLIRHVGTTLGLLLFCLFCATSVPGVGIVWSICGSSVGFLVCYLLPALLYLKIRAHKKMNARKVGAWAVILVTLVAMYFCTKHAVTKAIGTL
ncbi:unnamed protein product [Discosporangium mesarthrocarpum]